MGMNVHMYTQIFRVPCEIFHHLCGDERRERESEAHAQKEDLQKVSKKSATEQLLQATTASLGESVVL